MKLISWIVAQAINFFISTCRAKPNVPTIKLYKIQIINIIYKFVLLKIFKSINKQYRADLTKNPLKKIEKPVGASTWTFNDQ